MGTGTEAPTSLGPPASTPAMSSADSGQHGRFLPGTMVAGRYRIVGLLGRGGMGEVYRADDLKLGQQVALKFLPGRMVADDEQVKRLFDEVRMARNVSHPNVCRVWDVSETEGMHYVSMEYVDGEDLSSLLRRIGRLPEDKAVEIARQLCAALAAAHDEGILHRDLKPANVMLDGRGRVKLTDFGLSAVAEVRAGTPIYMAPEQLDGTGVSVQSDLYSLGLVLHELFTGKRVFEADGFDELSRLHQTSMTTSLTRTSGLDPAVDRVIQRCLEKDPDKRPKSALAVAAGLPGADPLAAALAAGETPSPEMVCEAGGEGSLSIAIALPLLLLAIVCAVAVGMLQSSRSLVGWVPFDMSAAMLEARALEIVADLGHATDHADSASGFLSNRSYINWLRKQDVAAARWETVSNGRAAAVLFWWRSSPSVLVPGAVGGVKLAPSVTESNPARAIPGMISLRLDTLGRLIWLDVAPVRLDDAESAGDEAGSAAAPAATAATDWAHVFELMGLDMESFTSVPPLLIPDHFADERVAWEGTYPEDPEASLRIEAAALRGRPTSIRRFTPDNPLVSPASSATASGSGIGLVTVLTIGVVLVSFALVLTAVFGGLYVAQRNVRSGRGDSRGARRLGFAISGTMAVVWLLSEHTLSANDVNAFVTMLAFAGAAAGLTWALYLAVEPFMRCQAPEALIGWARLLDGRWADPLIGRDILIGCAAGAVSRLLTVVPIAIGERTATSGDYVGLPILSVTGVFAEVASNAIAYVILGLGLSFLYGLSFLALGRRPWAAYATWLILLGGIGFLPGVTVNDTRMAATVLASVVWVLGWALWLFVLFRLGILAFVVMTTAAQLLTETLPTMDLSAWYASSMVTGLTIFIALAAYAFFRCVQWKGGLAEALGGD